MKTQLEKEHSMHDHTVCASSRYSFLHPRRTFLRTVGIAGVGAGILSAFGLASVRAVTDQCAIQEDGSSAGFLRTCIDKRFVAGSRTAFEQATALSGISYWHESYAGGSALPPPNTIGEDYAIEHGVTILGWQAHIDGCGGQPGVSDQEIEARLDAMVAEKLKEYPNLRHFRILASVNGVAIKEVFPSTALSGE